MPIRLEKPLFQTRRFRPGIPQSILDSMVPSEEPEYYHTVNAPFARTFREVAAASGLTRKDILQRLQPNQNVTKSYRVIDTVLDGSKTRPQALQRVADALGISPETYAKIEAEDRAWQLERAQGRRLRHLHNAYRRYGPHFYILPRIDWWPCLLSITGDGFLYAQLPHGVENGEFITPDFDEISGIIQNSTDWHHPRLGKNAGAYLYHRLPNQMATFDLEGNFIAEGDCSLAPPPGTRRFMPL